MVSAFVNCELTNYFNFKEKSMQQNVNSNNFGQPIEISDLCYDPLFRRLTSKTYGISLRAQLDKLLLALVDKKGQPVSREELIDTVWDGNYHTGCKALTHSICKLRKVFDDLGDNKTKIITIPKYGYYITTGNY